MTRDEPLSGAPPASGIEISGPVAQGYEQILTPEALAFVEALVREFTPARNDLLRRRAERQAEVDAGRLPDFLPETAGVREAEWHVAPAPADLHDRRVEITGPSGDRKMVINALNSGARVFMADFEDSLSSTWANVIGGQINLRDAVRRTISYYQPGRQRIPAQRANRYPPGAPERLAPEREARAARWRAGAWRHLRLRSLLLPQRR